MSVKKYGIYIAYPPTVDLRREGLGRLLAAFIKGSIGREDIKFVVACPSWTRDSLRQLFASEGFDLDTIELISPCRKPLLLSSYECLSYLTGGRFRYKAIRGVAYILKYFHASFQQRLKKSRNLLVIVPLGIFYMPIYFGGSLGSAVKLRMQKLHHLQPRVQRKLARSSRFRGIVSALKKLPTSPKQFNIIMRLYQIMADHEARMLVKHINKRHDITAWYSPTAFWPSFNNITGPRLMCVPDVVLSEFPVGFAQMGGRRFLSGFVNTELAIRGCARFVTYSDEVKWNTLVKRYSAHAPDVHVIHHAPSLLNHWVNITGFADNEEASKQYCQTLLRGILMQHGAPSYRKGFDNLSMKFIFYASQFRPNKNIISLLRAYEYLLRKRFISHKLILTGDVNVLPVIKDFIRDHALGNDVFCFHALTAPELAACYKLADIAVNPSFSEGGCPFTFTEALSVGTPVVMADIPVTREVLNDPALEPMYFDPYDWQNMAERMEWAIHHRAELLAVQKPVHARLSTRVWGDVVNEHLAILESLS